MCFAFYELPFGYKISSHEWCRLQMLPSTIILNTATPFFIIIFEAMCSSEMLLMYLCTFKTRRSHYLQLLYLSMYVSYDLTKKIICYANVECLCLPVCHRHVLQSILRQQKPMQNEWKCPRAFNLVRASFNHAKHIVWSYALSHYQFLWKQIHVGDNEKRMQTVQSIDNILTYLCALFTSWRRAYHSNIHESNVLYVSFMMKTTSFFFWLQISILFVPLNASKIKME